MSLTDELEAFRCRMTKETKAEEVDLADLGCEMIERALMARAVIRLFDRIGQADRCLVDRMSKMLPAPYNPEPLPYNVVDYPNGDCDQTAGPLTRAVDALYGHRRAG